MPAGVAPRRAVYQGDQLHQARRFAALGHPMRWQIVLLLLREPEATLSLQDLERETGHAISQSSLSNHVRTLLQTDLLELAEKRGLYRYYRVKRARLVELHAALSALLEAR